jgi:hypothetical protein
MIQLLVNTHTYVHMKNEMKNERYSRPRIRTTALALLAVPGLDYLSAIAVYAEGMEETETQQDILGKPITV